MSRRLLIDSHILLWLAFESDRLIPSVKEALLAADEVLVSDASLLELAIKYKSRKLAYSPADILEGVVATEVARLAITDRHIMMYPDIDLPHKDPFDTLLIAQSRVERAPLVTANRMLLDCSYDTIDAR